MAEYNSQSIDIDLEEMFNGLSNKGQEEFLINMFSKLFDEDSKSNVVNNNMLHLENNAVFCIITKTFWRMNSSDKKEIAERIADILTPEQREELVKYIKGGIDMKKIKSKTVQDYVMNDMVFKVDMPRLLKEIAECSKSTPYPKTFRIMARVLGILAERAVEIDDPALNIIMMHLGLYEGVHDKNASKVISRLRKLITDNQKSGE